MKTAQKPAVRLLGIDPGYERVGVAIIEKGGDGKEKVIFSGCIQTEKKFEHSKRLQTLIEKLEEIIDVHTPIALSIEKLFFNENQKTALLVAEARGAILLTCARKEMGIFEYTPLEIKVAITGYGRADKRQMCKMIEKIINIPEKIRYDDEYDAIAAALTCFARGEDKKLST